MVGADVDERKKNDEEDNDGGACFRNHFTTAKILPILLISPLFSHSQTLIHSFANNFTSPFSRKSPQAPPLNLTTTPTLSLTDSLIDSRHRQTYELYGRPEFAPFTSREELPTHLGHAEPFPPPLGQSETDVVPIQVLILLMMMRRVMEVTGVSSFASATASASASTSRRASADDAENNVGGGGGSCGGNDGGGHDVKKNNLVAHQTLPTHVTNTTISTMMTNSSSTKLRRENHCRHRNHHPHRQDPSPIPDLDPDWRCGCTDQHREISPSTTSAASFPSSLVDHTSQNKFPTLPRRRSSSTSTPKRRPEPITIPSRADPRHDRPITPLTGREQKKHLFPFRDRSSSPTTPERESSSSPTYSHHGSPRFSYHLRVPSNMISDQRYMPTSPLSPTMKPSTPQSPRQRPTSSSNTSGMRLNLPRFHPAVYQLPSGPTSPNASAAMQRTPGNPYRLTSETQKVLRQYREFVAGVAMSPRTGSPQFPARPGSPRIRPLGSPGPVTPLTLEGDGDYLGAMSSQHHQTDSSSSTPLGAPTSQQELVEKFIRQEKERAAEKDRLRAK